MANLKQATTTPANLKNMKPISSPAGGTTGGPSGIPPVALTGLSPTGIGPIPALLGTTYDTIRQWIRPSNNPQYRIFPLPAKASSQISSIVNSTVSESVNPITSVPFNAITTGINTTALKVGNGGVLNAQGTGVINATEINGIPITGTLTHAGQIPISQPGNASAVWADPLVQGLYPTGTNVLTGGTGSTSINPVLIGAQDPSNLLQNLRVDASKNLFVTGTLAGGLTNNNAAPGATNVGVLPNIANASDPSWTEGYQTLLSSTLAGYLRTILHTETTKVIGTVRVQGNVGGVLDAATGAGVPANAVQVGGSDGTNLRALTTDTTGTLITRPAAPTTSLYTLAAISISSSGVIGPAASGSTTVRIYRIFFVNSSTTTSTAVMIQDSTPTNLSGAFLLSSGGSFALDGKGDPLFISAAGKAIQLNLSVGVQISGTVWYTQS